MRPQASVPTTRPADGPPERDDSADLGLHHVAATLDSSASEVARPARLSSGEVLSERFVIERLAGSGGMGAVYRALDRLTGEAVALKVTSHPGRHEGRFAQEVHVLAELQHPAIVRYVAHGATPQGQLYLAMQWLDGEDLARRLARAALDVAESLAIARRLAEGLSVAHARGLVHRDVKPSNVLLVQRDPARATLLDFGIVQMGLAGWAPTVRARTQTGTVLGTVGYMSPEQTIADKQLDARTDVFALGCVLFECLTGQPAFSGEHAAAVLAKVLREQAPRVCELRPELPPALDDLVARLLAKERAGRPQDGGAVLRELEALGTVAGTAPDTSARLRVGLSVGEQRLVCVMLATMPGELDRTRAGEIVRSHGGEEARLANGVLLVTLSARGSTSEPAVTAAGCALELREAFPSARIVLATGRAQTGAGGPTGPVIDTAAALLAQSTLPGIWIDEVTASLSGDRFDVRLDGGAQVLLARSRGADAPRTLLGKPTPCVGRDKELSLLELTLRECIEESVARALLVTGPPGQGKSRLRHELASRAREREGLAILTARADPVGAGSALMLVRQLVRQAVGLREGDLAAEQHTRLRAYVADVCKGGDFARIADFLGELIGVPSIEGASLQLRAARDDPQVMAVWLRRSFGEWLAAECARRPLLVVLEDLHWGDLPSVTYLGEGLRSLRDRPFMVLALARPEVHNVFRDLWAGAERQEIALGRLAPRAAERLVRAALGEGIARDVVARIVERADGNAFYLEELIRCTAEGDGNALPETVLALVQSRLERLEPEARRLVRAASIFGEVFWRDGVAALMGAADTQDVGAWLESLARAEVISLAPDCRYPGDREYVFRHALLCEAAHAMLTEADRSTGHRLAGEWLERAGENEPLILADHLERGGEPKRAAPWLARAARGAYRGSDFEAAIALGHRGLACAPDDADRSALLQALAFAHMYRGEFRSFVDFAQQSLPLCNVGSTEWLRVVAALLMGGANLGDVNLTATTIQAVLSVPLPPEPSGPFGSAVWMACLGLHLMGQGALAHSLLGRAEELEKRVSDPDPVFVIWLRVARGLMEGTGNARLGRALASLADARKLAEQTEFGLARAPAIAFSIFVLAICGHCARAESAVRDLQATGSRALIDWGMLYTGWAWLWTGRWSEAIARLRSLLDRSDPLLVLNARSYLAVALAETGDDDAATREATALLETANPRASQAEAGLEALAIVALRQHRYAEALPYAERGLDGQRRINQDFPSSFRWVRAKVLHALSRTDEARAAIREARDEVLRIAETIDDPELRESYLTKVVNNVRTLELAAAWLDA